jgi:putative ABC transport system ATP-binding protein
MNTSVDDNNVKYQAQLRDIYKEYKKGSTSVNVLQGLDLDIKTGDFIAIMGPSGSGKTTLLNLLGGLDRPSTGSIKIGDQLVSQFSSAELAQWRLDHVGFIFQFYNLLPILTAHQNIELPLSLMPLNKADRIRRVDAALEVVGLSERGKHFPNELSGGQQQRVGIARAIVTDPSILLCDEPTGDLDSESGAQVLKLLKMLNEQYNKTIIMVTHDPKAATCANRLVKLDQGKLVEDSVNHDEA